MVQTPSTQLLPLGSKAPDFRLPDATGKLVGLDDARDARAVIVAFICNHCPFVKHIRDGLADFGRQYVQRGVALFAINANDVESHPEDGPEKMGEEAADAGYVFPYLLDESQEVAKTYRAACTPDFFLFDEGRALVYRGQFDGSRPGNDVPVTGEDLRAATDAVLAGNPLPGDQRPSIGCNIKWKPGSEPEYFPTA